MAANFKNMGPSCCCCKQIWASYGLSQWGMAVPATFEWGTSVPWPTKTIVGNGDFDHVNRLSLYAFRNGSVNDVYLHHEKPTSKPLTSWVKTDANTADGDLPGGHGFVNGKFDISWTGGSRTNVDGTIAVNALSLDGGSGDDFPATADTTVVARQTESLVVQRSMSTNELLIDYWLGCVDPDNQRVIDVTVRTVDPSNDELVVHKCNYDGSGDTELFTLPIGDSPDYNWQFTHLHYNRITETVFAWLYRGLGNLPYTGSPAPYFEIVEFPLDGTPPSVIHSFPVKRLLSGSLYTGNVFVLEIDYTNEKIVWERQEVTTDLGTTIDRLIQRSDFDGSNLETLLTETTPLAYSHIGWQWSHKDNCFYLMTNNPSLSIAADTTNGFWRVEPDWSDKTLLFSRSDLNRTLSYFRLGCGYETLGPSSMA